MLAVEEVLVITVLVVVAVVVAALEDLNSRTQVTAIHVWVEMVPQTLAVVVVAAGVALAPVRAVRA
jgi:hypothetical protein